MKTVGFVIITWNSKKYIKACIDSILKIEKFNTKISICDNGSTDGTIEDIKEYGDRVIGNFLPKNKGTTISRNIAIKALEDVDFYCVLDSDTEIIDEDGFVKMMDLLESDESIGIVGPQLYSKDEVLQYSGRNIPTLKEKLYKVLPFKKKKEEALKLEHINYDEKPDVFSVGYLMSACWLFTKKTLDTIGLLDEKIFYAPEDVEYCMRSWVNGLSVKYFKPCKVLHHWQRLSRKKLFSKHNYEHLKGLFYLNRKYKKHKIEVK